MLVRAMTVMNKAGPRNTAPVEAWMAVMISGVTPPTVAPVLQAAAPFAQSLSDSPQRNTETLSNCFAAAAAAHQSCGPG